MTIFFYTYLYFSKIHPTEQVFEKFIQLSSLFFFLHILRLSYHFYYINLKNLIYLLPIWYEHSSMEFKFASWNEFWDSSKGPKSIDGERRGPIWVDRGSNHCGLWALQAF